MDTIFIYSFICPEEVFQDIFITFGIWDVYNSCFTTKTILSAKVHTMRYMVGRAGTVEAWEQREGWCIAQSRDVKEVGYLGQRTESQPKKIIQLHPGLSVTRCSAIDATGETGYLIFAR